MSPARDKSTIVNARGERAARIAAIVHLVETGDRCSRRVPGMKYIRTIITAVDPRNATQKFAVLKIERGIGRRMKNKNPATLATEIAISASLPDFFF